MRQGSSMKPTSSMPPILPIIAVAEEIDGLPQSADSCPPWSSQRPNKLGSSLDQKFVLLSQPSIFRVVFSNQRRLGKIRKKGERWKRSGVRTKSGLAHSRPWTSAI
jgi:hypothetical protein